MKGAQKPLPDELEIVVGLEAEGYEWECDEWGWGYHHLKDDALEMILKLRSIAFLDLFESCEGGGTTDAGLAHLTGNTSLICLRLGPGITDAGLVHLEGLTQLTELRLDNADGVTDAGMQSVVRLKNLDNLSIQFTGVGDAGLETLRELSHLQHLEVAATKVTDASIPRLIQFQKLTRLTVTYSGVTPQGIELLRSALPLCRID